MIVKGPVTVEEIGEFEDEYVYDIGVDGDRNWFFANNILIHNSSYFSAVPVLDTPYFKEAFPDFEPTKDGYIKLYDEAADIVNATFPPFMVEAFNTTLDRGEIIKAGREIVASKALFIKKKKYAALIYDKEGERYDLKGKPGKIKAMGLDLKRADTPKVVQDFLSEILLDVLTDHGEEEIIQKILTFRQRFKQLPPWEMGTPRKVNGLTKYREIVETRPDTLTEVAVKAKRDTIPSHVLASLNWNRMLEMNHDLYSMRITDGSKVVVCKLKKGPWKMSAIAYPIDEPHLPEWFKELDFDCQAMEDGIIDKKVKNLLSVLNWRLDESRDDFVTDFFTWS